MEDDRFPGARRLNLSSGEFKKNGYINVDRDAHLKPDVLHDLEAFPCSFPDNRLDLITAKYVLEHREKPFEVMRELHRILTNGGTLVIKVPHFSRDLPMQTMSEILLSHSRIFSTPLSEGETRAYNSFFRR